jgi:S1-C subfamily serine protease
MRLLLCLFITISVTNPATGRDFKFADMQSRIQATISKSMPAVVSCGLKGRPGGFSAVIISKDGYVLTAAHCVMASAKKKDTKYIVRLSDGRTTEATALGFNRRLDCALMKITKEGEWPFVNMGDSSQLVKNQPCVGISHPAGHNPKRGAVVRFGRVKEVVTPVAGMVQTTCRIEPGDSGGPIFDLDGNVIGINSQIRSDLSRNYQVAINTFHEYWEQLKKPGVFNPKGTPGVPSLGLSMNNTKKGITVRSTQKDSIAATGGLKRGDRITQVNKRRVMTSNQLTREYIKLYQTGADKISLTVKSGDEEPNEVFLTLPDRPERSGEAIPELESLIALVEPLEDKLDETTVLIASQQATRPMSVYGTRISDNGLIVSKSSQVGDDDISVKLRTGELLPTIVIARDEAMDLVLLKCDGLTDSNFVSLDDASTQSLDLGRILLSPNSRGPGCVSVIGSNVFGSTSPTAIPPKVIVGIRWNTKLKPVRILSVMPKSPAAKAGVKAKDILLKIGVPTDDGFEDRPIKSAADAQKIFQSLKPNDRITFTLNRSGAETVTMIKVAPRPNIQVRRHAADFLVGGKSQRRTGFKSIFTHDATLQQKECGGPVFDIDGNFVAINIARHSRAQFYAVPAAEVEQFVNKNLPK